MADPITTDLGTISADHPAQKVYVRCKWADEWEEKPHLFCDSIELFAAPEVSRAALVYERYGVGIQRGQTTFAEVPPLDLAGMYVKVEIDQPTASEDDPADPITWYGIITEETRDNHGELDKLESAGKLSSGAQQWDAFGLEYLLDRTPLTQTFLDDDTTLEIPIAFNARRSTLEGEEVLGNRGESASAESLLAKFAATVDDNTARWSANEAIRYLLAYHTPEDSDGEIIIPFELVGQLEALTWHEPVLNPRGMSIKQALDALINRNRLHGYTVEVTEDENGPDRAYIRVFSFAPEDIDIELSTGELYAYPANDRQKTLDFERALDVLQAPTGYSYSQQYEQIVAVGARRLCCGTFSISNGELQKRWTDELETEYITGASGQAGYDALDDCEKADRDSNWRAVDKYASVYSWLTIPADWNGYVGDGLSGGITAPLCAELFDAAGRELPAEELATSDPIPFLYSSLRFARHLPLLTDHDYSGKNIENRQVTNNSPEGQQPEYLRPLVLIQLPDDGSGTTRYQQVERLNAAAHLDLPEAEPITWACNVRVLQNEPGIELRVMGGPQWLLAGSFGYSDCEFGDREPVQLSYQTVIATCAIEWPAEVTATYPAEIDAEAFAGDIPRVLRIHVPQYRLDYVAPNTIVAIEDGVPVRTTTGGFVRDDRDQLKQIARLAYEWYSKPRKAFTFAYRQVNNFFSIGDLITKIGPEDDPERQQEVNAVVTSIRWNLLAGTTEITTDYAAFDAVSLFR